jgi:DNA-binding XRE family transcriptional regulator
MDRRDGGGSGPRRRLVTKAEINRRKYLKQLGSVLVEARRRHDKSQAEVAERMGISRAQLSKHETGKLEMPLQRFLTWCAILEELPEKVIPLLR